MEPKVADTFANCLEQDPDCSDYFNNAHFPDGMISPVGYCQIANHFGLQHTTCGVGRLKIAADKGISSQYAKNLQPDVLLFLRLRRHYFHDSLVQNITVAAHG